MKRFLAFMLVLVMVLSLAACGKDNEAPDEGISQDTEITSPAEPDEGPVEAVTPEVATFTDAEEFERALSYAPPAFDDVAGFTQPSLTAVEGTEETEVLGFKILTPVADATVSEYTGTFDNSVIPITTYTKGTEGEDNYKAAILYSIATKGITDKNAWLSSSLTAVTSMKEASPLTNKYQHFTTCTGDGYLATLWEGWDTISEEGYIGYNANYSVYLLMPDQQQIANTNVALGFSQIPTTKARQNRDLFDTRTALIEDLKMFSGLYGVAEPLTALLENGQNAAGFKKDKLPEEPGETAYSRADTFKKEYAVDPPILETVYGYNFVYPEISKAEEIDAEGYKYLIPPKNTKVGGWTSKGSAFENPNIDELTRISANASTNSTASTPAKFLDWVTMNETPPGGAFTHVGDSYVAHVIQEHEYDGSSRTTADWKCVFYVYDSDLGMGIKVTAEASLGYRADVAGATEKFSSELAVIMPYIGSLFGIEQAATETITAFNEAGWGE